MTDIEQQVRKEAECTFYRDGDRIVQRLRGRDEFGEPQVTEQYMPIEAAIAMHKELGTALLSERSKPSLMVGFSEEEEEADGWRYKTPHGWVVTKTKTSSDSQPLFANTRAVSIDQLMEVVTEWLTHDGREPDNTRQQPMPMSDLRERLMKIMP